MSNTIIALRMALSLALVAVTFTTLKAQPLKPLAQYTVTYTTAAGTSATQNISSQARKVRVICSTACHVAFAVTPVVAAATVPVFLAANREEYFSVTPGAVINVVADSSGGTLYVTEVE